MSEPGTVQRKTLILFAVAYAILIVLGICAVLGAVAFSVSGGKASKQSVQSVENSVQGIQQKLNPGALQAYKDACEIQIRGAANDGVTLVECKLTDPKAVDLKHNPDVNGDHALVVLSIKASDGQAYVTYVELDKTAWTQTNYKVTPLEKGLPTIEAPR